MELDPGQWRYAAMMVSDLLRGGQHAKAVVVAEASARRFPTTNSLALLHARALVASGRYQQAAGLLTSLDLLPSEGVTVWQSLFHETYLMLAVGANESGLLRSGDAIDRHGATVAGKAGCRQTLPRRR